MSSEATFEDVWTRAGAAVATLAQPHDQTIRPALATATGGQDLPRLPMTEDAAAEADLHLRERLGEGGMGVVWLARQISLDREVAIKRVKPGASPRAGDALVREARFMGGLEHPGILPVHALGADGDGRPSLVMKKVDGVSWRTLIREPDHPWWHAEGLPERLARHVEILVDVARAVQYAHTRGVLHRDLKPENVMIGAFGEVYVMDWGIAMRAGGDRGGVVGTPAYMAPEMLDPTARIDERTDVYLLGACLFEAATGRPPHEGDDLQAVMRSVHHSDVHPGDDVPAELADVVRRACARKPDDRFASVGDLVRQLQWTQRHNASLRLAEAARERLERLEQAIADGERGATIENLFTECRFGLRQAMEACDDADVHDALRRAIAVMAPYRVAHGDLDGAEALLGQVDDGPDLADARGRLAAAREEQRRVVATAREHDLNVGRGERLAVIAALLVFGFLVSGAILAAVARPGVEYGPGTAAAIMAVLCVIVGAGVAWMWTTRSSVATAVNKALTVVMLASSLAILGNRLVAWRFGAPVPAMLATDDLILALGMVVCSGIATKDFALAAIPFVGVALAIAAFPAAALPLFALSTVLGTAAAGLATWRSR